VHRVLRLFRRYLRVFDSDESVISDVVPETLKLESDLGKLNLSEFLTEARKSELLSVLRWRENVLLDASVKVRLVEDVHYAAYLLDPNLCSFDVSPFISRLSALARRYAKANGALDANVKELMSKKCVAFQTQKALWEEYRGSYSKKRYLKVNHLMWLSSRLCENR